MDQAVNYVRRGARIGGAIGGLGMASAGGLYGFFADDPKHERTTKQRVIGGALGAGLGGYLGHGSGRLVGAIHHANKWIGGHRPLATKPDWLKGAKTKSEARRAYHAQARKAHPDLHGGSDDHIKKINAEWENHEHIFKTAMLNAFADELVKIARLYTL